MELMKGGRGCRMFFLKVINVLVRLAKSVQMCNEFIPNIVHWYFANLTVFHQPLSNHGSPKAMLR